MSGNQNTIKSIPLNKIVVVEGFNTRRAEDVDPSSEDIRVLAEDININGLLTPIQVTPIAGEKDSFHLVAGHRRLTAIRYANEHLGANIKDALAVVRRDLSDAERDAILLSDRLAQRLDPLGTALAMKRYMEREGLTQTQVAEKFRLTVAYAGDLKLLANAPETVQEAVQEGVLAATEAVRTIKEYGEEGAAVIAEEAMKEAEAEAPKDEAPADTSPSEGDTETDAGPDVPAVKRSKAKKTRQDTERIAKNKNIAPKRKREPKAAPADIEGAASLPDLASHIAYMVDNLIAQYRIGNDAAVRSKIIDMGGWLRSYQQAGYEVKDAMSGISATTSDDELDFVVEPQSNAEAA